MKPIICPNCHEKFEIEDTQYSEIVAQVRNEQYEKDIAEKISDLKREQEAVLASAMSETENKHNQAMAAKDQEIARLQEQVKSQVYAQKREIEAIQGKAELKRKEELAEKDRQIQALKAKTDVAETEKQLAVTRAVQGKNSEIAELKAKIIQVEHEAEIREMGMKETHRVEVEGLKEALAQSKDFRQRLNTKMIGENLEQHCLAVFNRARADAFPNAIFGKDNDSVDHTKGDFIFRENTEDGIEILSIMFEMKNEGEETVKKQKNSKFLAKLNEDRRKKNCEYAVLVTTLEPDNDYYNDGIVTAYQYDKMIIIRPQFFLPLISILRRAALASLEARRELRLIQRENLDVQKFDETLIEIKDKFGWNCDQAQKHFQKTIKEINEAIKHLETVRDELEATGKQMGQANNKLQDLTIKKLTKGNIGMQQKFLDAGIEIA